MMGLVYARAGANQQPKHLDTPDIIGRIKKW